MHAMQSDLKPLKELRDELVRLLHEFSEFSFLYYRSETCIELLNAVAKHFFGELFHIMLDRLVLGVSKLTDPAGSGNRACLSIDYVHQELGKDGRYPHAEAARLISRAESVRSHLGLWRSKLIAHTDASVALGVVDAGQIVPGRIEEFLSIVQEYLDLLFDKFGLGPCPTSTPGVHGADELVQTLKQGMAFRDLFKGDPLKYHHMLTSSKYKDA